MQASELLLPLGGECLVYVGPPDYLDEPDRMPGLERFRVFGVKQGQGVLLKPGVWHGAPLAFGGQLNVAVLLLKDTGAMDTSLVRFEEHPVLIG
jgi:ureidoglycolate hydrolase